MLNEWINTSFICVPVQVTPTHSSRGWEGCKIINITRRMKIRLQLLTCSHTVTYRGFVGLRSVQQNAISELLTATLFMSCVPGCLWELSDWLAAAVTVGRDSMHKTKTLSLNPDVQVFFFFLVPKEERWTSKLTFDLSEPYSGGRKGLEQSANFGVQNEGEKKKSRTSLSLALLGSLSYEPPRWEEWAKSLTKSLS